MGRKARAGSPGLRLHKFYVSTSLFIEDCHSIDLFLISGNPILSWEDLP